MGGRICGSVTSSDFPATPHYFGRRYAAARGVKSSARGGRGGKNRSLAMNIVSYLYWEDLVVISSCA